MLICPNCGASVKLPEKSKTVLGRLLSKEDEGIHYLEIENVNPNNAKSKKEKENVTMGNTVNKANERENTLKAAGVDTGKYFSMTLPNGVSITVDEKGNKVEIEKQDEVVKSIIENGNLPAKKLYRRWVMAQFFRAFNHPQGYAYEMSILPYKYQWKMLVEEVKTLAKLEIEDQEYFEERIHFFNKNVVIALCEEYIQDLEKRIEKDFPVKYQRMKDENGYNVKIPYKTLYGKNIYVSKINKEFLSPIRRKIQAIKYANNYSKLYTELKQFVDKYVYKINKYVTSNFLDTYKGAGAYYTLQNMVLYHGCTLYEYEQKRYYGNWIKNGIEHSGMDAYNYMKSLLDEYEGQGWRWVGVIRQCIVDNDFEFHSKNA